MITFTPTKKAHTWHAYNDGQKFREIMNFLHLDKSVV